jgi:hypothetical protein
VTRALRFLALITALFVVLVRGSSVLSLALSCAVPDPSADQLCPLADEPREESALASVVIDAIDDADDDADAALAPSLPRIRLLSGGEASGMDRAALAAKLALASHARGLERPPRS